MNGQDGAADAIILEQDIQAAVDSLREGNTVVFPTETVYGLGADASNPDAVNRIFAIKGRPSEHPLIVHLADLSHIEDWVDCFSDQALELARTFWPGPLTMILPKNNRVPMEVTGGQNTIGLRVPDHPVAKALLSAFGGGIAAPSANRFGRVSPTTAEHVRDELGANAGLILDGGPCRIGVESTIISLANGDPVLLRPGSIPVEALEEALGQIVLTASSLRSPLRFPGMRPSHYAPSVPLEIHSPWQMAERIQKLEAQGLRVAVLKWRDESVYDGRCVEVLSMPDCPSEYGRILYATLRILERSGFDRLLAESLPSTNEWASVNDRIGRAATVIEQNGPGFAPLP